MTEQTIYAIYDDKAESIVGGLFLYRHDAAAVRFFSDVASDPQTTIHKHIEDHKLLAVAEIDVDSGHILDTPRPRVVITGKAWKAAQDASDANPEAAR